MRTIVRLWQPAMVNGTGIMDNVGVKSPHFLKNHDTLTDVVKGRGARRQHLSSVTIAQQRFRAKLLLCRVSPRAQRRTTAHRGCPHKHMAMTQDALSRPWICTISEANDILLDRQIAHSCSSSLLSWTWNSQSYVKQQ